jgi:hypothetical protein
MFSVDEDNNTLSGKIAVRFRHETKESGDRQETKCHFPLDHRVINPMENGWG